MFSDSLKAQTLPLNQRRGSDFMFRGSIKQNSIKNPTPHPITSRSLSLQAPPVVERGAFAKRSRSTKKREGKTLSLICLTLDEEGKHLEDLMWDGADIQGHSSV